MCYVDCALGLTQWDAPEGSSALSPQPLIRPPSPWTVGPPAYPTGLAIGSLRGTSWYPIYHDCAHEVALYHAETGSVRSAPWVCLRTDYGEIYFANLITRRTRWLPPHRWMEDWISRITYDDGVRGSPFEGHRLSQQVQPTSISRMRVEGGAPYMCHGAPQYASDTSDSSDTYPTPDTD